MNEKEMMPSPILILGSTGSVGEQAIDVALRMKIPVVALSAHRHWRRVEEQARLFHVRAVAMTDPSAASDLRTALSDTDIRVFSGEDGLLDMIRESKADFAVNAILGEAGLFPTLAVLESGKNLALANKESLVVAGKTVMRAAALAGVSVTPVDSEHSAIFQALRAGTDREVSRLILTASGGPFFGKKRDELSAITVAQTLAHPTWRMGAKITVDSATLMNKGFEVIEASYLFGVDVENIDVVIHRESMIHSMVEYIDHSIIAQLSVPDMRLCVQYALTAPKRMPAVIPRLDLSAIGTLSFSKPDEKAFPLLSKAREMLQCGGGCPAVLNAANEVAVDAFLHEKLSFPGISDLVIRICDDMPHAGNASSLSEILDMDREARERTRALLS